MTMSADFKFRSFANEDEDDTGFGGGAEGERERERRERESERKSEGGKEGGEDGTGNLSEDKRRKIVPGEISSSAFSSRSFNKLGGALPYELRFVERLSRIQICGLVALVLFLLLCFILILTNESKFAQRTSDLNAQLDSLTHLVSVHSEKFMEFRLSHDETSNRTRERIKTVVDVARADAKKAFDNATESSERGLDSFRNSASTEHHNIMGRLNELQRSKNALAMELRLETDRKMARLKFLLERELERNIAFARRGLESAIALEKRNFQAELRNVVSDVERITRQLVRDRNDVEEIIANMASEIKSKLNTFDDSFKNALRDQCANPLEHHCDKNADCVDTIKGYACFCKHGYHGDGKTCQDINECAEAFPHECHPNANCVNNEGSYSCVCKPGFSGDGKRKCDDVNECSSNPCHNLADCSNSQGSFQCICRQGYEGDGIASCTDVDECDGVKINECHADAICNNSVGSYTCKCKPGFRGDGYVCTDIDECATGTFTCDVNANCSNTAGGYSCACVVGYEGDGKSCSDVDECKTNICSADATCSNSAGSYACTCKRGFQGDGSVCDDVNECADVTLNNCSAHGICHNSRGGFSCSCPPDSHVGDGYTCAVDFMKASGNYTYHVERGNWDQAKRGCEGRGGYLVIIGSEEEDRLVREKPGYDNSKRWWVGAKCESRNRYFWAHTNVNFQDSYPPIGSGGSNIEECDATVDGITITGTVGNSNGWDDIRISDFNRRGGYICEYS